MKNVFIVFYDIKFDIKIKGVCLTLKDRLCRIFAIVCLVITFIAQKWWLIHQLDVKTEFLH